jgi:hypothetical protein
MWIKFFKSRWIDRRKHSLVPLPGVFMPVEDIRRVSDHPKPVPGNVAHGDFDVFILLPPLFKVIEKCLVLLFRKRLPT